MKPNRILHKIIPLFLLISAGIFNARLFAYSPGDLSNSDYCRKASPDRQASDSTKFRSTSIPAEYYDNSERTSTIKTDSVLVTASMPYKVCKDSSFTISLQVKNLSRQAIYCVSDMKELISFDKLLNTGMGIAKIDYMLSSYNKDKELVKMIMIAPDSIFTSEVTINLHDIRIFDFEKLKQRYLHRYFLKVDLNFAYVPSSSIIKKENIKHEAGGSYILMNLSDASYTAVVLDFGFFRCWIEKCR